MLLHDMGDVEGGCREARQLVKTPGMCRHWQHFAATPLHKRYKPLFNAFGIERTIDVRREARREFRRRLRRMWRVPYIEMRRYAARFLRRAGLKS